MPDLSQGGTIAARPGRPPGPLTPFLPGLAIAAFLLFLPLFTLQGGAPWGVLKDPDSYMQIVHLRGLLADGLGGDGLFMRDNAPYGFVLHWSRAYSLIVFALAAPLAAAVGWADAISGIAPMLGPIWMGVLIVVGVWAARPVCTAPERTAVGIALAWTPIMLVLGMFGNADHHIPVLIAWMALLGFALRIAIDGATWRQGVGAGLAAAVALWINVDSILPVSLGLAVIGLAWISDGGTHRRASLATAASFALAMLVVLAFDPPLAGLRSGYLDRLSIVHVVFALLFAGLWLALALAPQGAAAWRERLSVGLAGAVISAALLAAIFPQILSPELSVFGSLEGAALWDSIDEMQPAFRTIDNGILFMGGPIIGLAAALVFAWAARGSRAFPGWLLFIAVLAIASAAGLYRTRFALNPEALAALPIGMMAARIGPFVVRRIPAASAKIWGFLLGGLIVMSPPLGAAMLRAGPGAAPAAAPACAIPAVAAALNDPTFMGGRDHIIMTHPNDAPALLYWTGHRTVAGPYHRNVRGLADVDRFMTSRDGSAAREVAARRGFSYVLICRGRALAWPPRGTGDTLIARLQAGRPPAWLAAQPWPKGVKTDLRLFRVVLK